MLAARIDSPGYARTLQVDPLEPGPNEVTVAVRRAGICGTDIHILHGEFGGVYPIVPGHEFSGVVDAVGPGVTTVKVGDRVTADPNLACGECANCRREAWNHCERWEAVGVTLPGAFAERVTVPASSVYPIGDLSFEAAALAEPLACVVWGMRRVAVRDDDRVLMFGAGPMGCLMLQALLAEGVRDILVVEPNASRLETAGALGAHRTVADLAHLPPADTASFSLVVDVVGRPELLEAGLPFLRPRGRLWAFGVCAQGDLARISPYEIFRRDLSVVGSFALCRTIPESLALLQNGAVDVERIVSHVLPLSDFTEGLRLAQEAPDRMKIQFEVP